MIKIYKYRKIIAFTLVMLFILFGIFTFLKLSPHNLEIIKDNINKTSFINYKIILLHIFILIISFFLAFCGIGVFILIIYLLYEFYIIGFMISYYIKFYTIKGVINNLIFFSLYKFTFLFLFFIILIKYIKLFKYSIKIIKKENVDITKTVINIQIVNIFIILNDILVSLLGKYVLNLLHF